jgi:hypothetical protein
MVKSNVLVAAIILMLLSFLLIPVPQSMAASYKLLKPLAWTPWNCQNVPNQPVPGGTLTGRGCAQWTDDSSFLWAVGGDTRGPYAYQIITYATGYDRCYPSDPWTERMSTNATYYNTTYGTALRSTGYYFDCGQGASHSYQNFSEHYWQHTSSSQVYLTDGAALW